MTTYTYEDWGRLREIDYPCSADVRLGWDGENRRVWVEDGVGRWSYTYDAWGRVRRQEGCCQNEPGIDGVAVEAEYDDAGRNRYSRAGLFVLTDSGYPTIWWIDVHNNNKLVKVVDIH
ncbi:MAG: hypothetical protein C4337_10490 [Armatimonadota bacterium]